MSAGSVGKMDDAYWYGNSNMTPKQRADFNAWSESSNHPDIYMLPAVLFGLILILGLAYLYNKNSREQSAQQPPPEPVNGRRAADDYEAARETDAVLNDGDRRRWYDSTGPMEGQDAAGPASRGSGNKPPGRTE